MKTSEWTNNLTSLQTLQVPIQVHDAESICTAHSDFVTPEKFDSKTSWSVFLGCGHFELLTGYHVLLYIHKSMAINNNDGFLDVQLVVSSKG